MSKCTTSTSTSRLPHTTSSSPALLEDTDPRTPAAFTLVWYLYLHAKLRLLPQHKQAVSQYVPPSL